MSAAAEASDEHVLDHPAWTSLHGAHARFALTHGDAARYQPDVAPFVAVSDTPGESVWADLFALMGPGGTATLIDPPQPFPPGWEVIGMGYGVQMVEASVDAAHDDEAVKLGSADVPEMLDLVYRTKPGPFLPRTIELGRYLGIRRDGRLIAMAGERVRPPGWTEISAVCTDEAYRGQGLGARLVRAVAAGIHDRGDRAFLHALASNANAIRLYESLGFVLRRSRAFTTVHLPAG
jgi:N-acetylglutamate synthase-like GNAT family acetyltransferase